MPKYDQIKNNYVENSTAINLINKSINLGLSNYNHKFLVISLLVFIVFSPVLSQTSGGGYAESYLLRNAGARASSLAGAYTAVVNEPDAVFYNPAGLGFFAQKPMFSSSVAMLGYGRIHSTLAWAQAINSDIGVGIGINSLVSGAFEGRDIKGNSLGSLQDFQYCLTAAASYRIEFASVGAAIKMLKNNLIGSKISATGFAVDFGTKFNVLDLFSAGIAINNISGYSFWNTKNSQMENLPYTVRAGIAWEYGLNSDSYKERSTVDGSDYEVYIPPTRFVQLSIDATLNQHESAPSILFGVEATPHEMIAFRAGLTLYGDNMGATEVLPMTFWGTGFSIRPDLKELAGTELPFKVHIDYTISGDYIADNKISHFISLLLVFE